MGISPYLQERSDEQTLDFAVEMAWIQVCRIHSGSLRCFVSLLLHGRRWEELLDLGLPTDCSVSDAIALRQVLGFFQKLPSLPLGCDRKAAALEKFNEAEELCALTNELIRSVNAGRACFADRRVEPWIFRAQRKISRILGELPSWEEVVPRFGPGANIGIPKKEASRKRKLAGRHACSIDFASSLAQALESIPSLFFHEGDPVEGDIGCVTAAVKSGRIAFVPKTAKTDRTVMTEPSLNSFFQLGYGDWIADRLRLSGVDLSDQSRNQRLARIGSLTNDLATLDLSSASDTIAYELVWMLLPFDWAERLSILRTSRVLVSDACEIELEKFSSMGNGYTFPLESLIFYALAEAVSPAGSEVSVYGDDIIVPSACFQPLVALLSALGFVPNEKKSFYDGPFRESCGTDWLSGVDIRPFYLKGNISPQRLMLVHNFFARNFDPEMASAVLAHLHPTFVLWGPDGYGDGHLVGDWNAQPHRREIPLNKRKPGGWGGWVFETFVSQPKRDFRVLPGDRILPFYSIYVSGVEELNMDPRERYPRTPGGRKATSIRENREFALGFEASSDTYVHTPVKGSEDEWTIGDTLPGVSRVRRISIYTLTR